VRIEVAAVVMAMTVAATTMVVGQSRGFFAEGEE
jgi:hypothetical protein